MLGGHGRRHGVDLLIQALEVIEVDRVQALDDLGRHLPGIAQARDHAGDLQHAQVGAVVAHTRVAQRLDLVAGGGQAHSALSVQRAVAIHVADGQREVVFGLWHQLRSYLTRSSPSWAMWISSKSASLESGTSAPTT